MSNDEAVRARNIETARKALGAVGNAEAQLAHYTDDVVFEMPFAVPPLRYESKATMVERLGKVFSTLEMKLTINDIYPMEDPNMLVAEFVSNGRNLATGAPYGNSYIAILWFRDGLISKQREFFNPGAARTS